jgi:phospholipid-translocating ATPase
MELKKLHMGTMSYGIDSMDEIVSHLETAYEQTRPNYKRAGTSANIQPSGGIVGISGKGRRDISSRIKDIVQALALCHNVSIIYFQRVMIYLSFLQLTMNCVGHACY